MVIREVCPKKRLAHNQTISSSEFFLNAGGAEMFGVAGECWSLSGKGRGIIARRLTEIKLIFFPDGAFCWQVVIVWT